MKNLWLALCLLYQLNIAWTQQITLEGQISIFNSAYTSGRIDYVQNAMVRSDFATLALTDSNGKFRLTFNEVEVGSTIQLEVEKKGFEVVNNKELRNVIVGGKALLKVFMVPQGQVVKARAAYYGINQKALVSGHEKVISELQKEKNEQKRQIEYKDSLLRAKEPSRFIPLENIKIDRSNKDKALFFAINDYEDKGWVDLGTPIKDAKDIAGILENKYGFSTEIVSNPKKLDIQKKLHELSQRNYADDEQLFLYFTGHGIFDAFPGEQKKGLGYFIPADAKYDDLFKDSYLAYVRLLPIIDNIPCKHILISIDACFSGSFFSYKDDNRPNAFTSGEKLIRNVMPHTSRIGLTSGSFEPVKSGTYHSPYARKFLEALSSGGGEDRILTVTELYSYLENISPRPQRGYFGKHDSEGDFLFVLKENTNNTAVLEDSAEHLADLKAFEWTENENTLEAYQKYIKEYPNGAFIERAKRKEAVIAENTEWEIAKMLSTKEAYQKYLDAYPNGAYKESALKFINKKPNTDFKSILGDLSVNNDFPEDAQTGTFTDSRDQQEYKWLRMKDGKIWMGENLNYESTDSWCYDDKESNCEKYGRLYNWDAADKACPDGWHLASEKEWSKLIEVYGGNEKAYELLIKGGTSGFYALLGGHRGSGGKCNNLGKYGRYWSSTGKSSGRAWRFTFHQPDSRLISSGYYKNSSFSCRCVRD